MNFYTNVHQYRSDILLRGFENGEKIQRSIPLSPYIFTNDKTSIEEYKSIDGKTVYKKEFENVYEAREYIKQFRDVSGKLMYGNTNFLYNFIDDHYPGEIDYDPALISVVTIDIEIEATGGFPDITKADRPLTSLTVRKNGKSVVLAMKDYTPEKESVTFIKCKDEADLLSKFLTIWRSKQYLPDIVTGWNVEGFDMPYMINRISRILGPESAKKLSPWGLLDEREVEIAGRQIIIPVIVGITILDYLQLYRKFSFTMRESYKLDFICDLELGEKKLDYEQLGYENLTDFYNNDFQNYVNYNIRDVELVDMLDDKLKFIEQVFAIAYDAKVNYLDTFTSVRMWDIIITNYLKQKNIVVPMFDPSKRQKDNPIVGAYVKDPQIGMHEWVCSFDLNSLYPHLIMQYNISPETYKGMFSSLATSDGVDKILNGALNDFGIRNEIESSNYTVAASGCYYDKDRQGFLSELMQKMYDDRVKYKNQMIEAKKKFEKEKTYELEKEIARFHNMQLAKKIQLNSAYGALANKFFRWYDIRFAESITKSGQLSIRWAENKMNEFLNKQLGTTNVDYVIAVDTDSMYLNLSGVVDKYIDKDKSIDEKVNILNKYCNDVIEKQLNKYYDELAVYVNAYAQKMKMKREAIANKGIFIAKKRYILNVYDNEGVRYSEPKLKMMGVEAVRSSTPQSVRNSITKAFNIIMTKSEDEMIDYIAEEREKFSKLPFEDVSFPRGCKDLEKWSDNSKNTIKVFKLGTPIHVKGALLYNNHLKKKGLDNKYDLIYSGEKIKFCYLKTPNYLGEHVISTPGKLPKELNLDSLIDYDKQFEKAFLEPLSSILDTIGWKTERHSTLEGFFG